jgi:hypothetical protein
MKFLQLIAASVSAQQVLREVTDSEALFGLKSAPVKNRFGNFETVKMHDEENGIFEKLIELGGDSNHYYFDYEQQSKHLEDLTKYIKGEKAFKQPGRGNNDTCHSLRNNTAPTPDDAFMFAPAFTG